jgi:hypothetical protein
MADGPDSRGWEWGELAVLAFPALPQIALEQCLYLSPESPRSHFIPRHADSITCLQEVLIECPLGYLTAVLIKVKPGDLW